MTSRAKRGVGIALARAALDVDHPAAVTGESFDAGVEVERVIERVDVVISLAKHVEECARID